MSNQVSMNGAGLARWRRCQALQTAPLPESEEETMVDFSIAESRRRLSWLLWLFTISHSSGQMQSRRGSKERTEDTHEMHHQNMASLGRFPGVLW